MNLKCHLVFASIIHCSALQKMQCNNETITGSISGSEMITGKEQEQHLFLHTIPTYKNYHRSRSGKGYKMRTFVKEARWFKTLSHSLWSSVDFGHSPYRKQADIINGGAEGKGAKHVRGQILGMVPVVFNGKTHKRVSKTGYPPSVTEELNVKETM